MKSYHKELSLNTTERMEFVNITRDVELCVKESDIKRGFA